MRHGLRLFLALTLCGVLDAAGEPIAGKPVDLKASDGTKLAATYYAREQPGPGILLFHQCNRDRSTWNNLAAQLAEKGFHVLTLDYRGYGQSGGPRHLELPPDQALAANQKWRGDADVAFAYLRSQPGVNGASVGAGGASCGVNQSIQLARRHPANPASSNAWDSLGDAFLADGQGDKARQAAEKSLSLVDSDPSENEDRRKLIRDSAQQKLSQLKTTPPPK